MPHTCDAVDLGRREEKEHLTCLALSSRRWASRKKARLTTRIAQDDFQYTACARIQSSPDS